MPNIHPTSVVHPQAELADDVIVHPFVVIEKLVKVGSGTELLAGTVLLSGTQIGANCHLGPYASIGGKPMDKGFKGENSYVKIGNNVEVRDFASIHRASGENRATCIGEGSLIMSYAHVSHNVQIGKEVTITTLTHLAGHVEIEDYAFLSSSITVHQFARIGAYAMVGLQSCVSQDILPFSMANGNRAKHYRLNKIGLQRQGISGERYKLIEQGICAFRRGNWQSLEKLATQSDDVNYILEFKLTSKRGICGFI